MVYHLQVKVTTAGTPVTLASVSTRADWIQVTAIAANSGPVYLGGANQVCGNATSGTFGVILTPAGTENGVFRGFFYPSQTTARAPWDLSKIPLNADNSGDGVNVYYGRA